MSSEKPGLLNESQGFSFLNAEYKGKLLYSKYNPEKNIEAVIERTTLLPGTLIILFSPVLFYGVESLLKKLPENSVLCAFEADRNLYDFSLPFIKPEGLPYYSQNDLADFDSFIRKECRSGKIKRAVSFNMSASVHENKARLCTRNIIKNLTLPSLKKEAVVKSVSKPILVLGAGESLEELLHFSQVLKSGHFFIIASDAALKPLEDSGIKPDAVCVLESRHAVLDFFTGTDTTDILYLGDLTSRYEAALLFEKRYFFLTEFTESFFLEKIKKIASDAKVISPLGSVGLFALEAALFLRENEDVPVYISGLDFSFTSGKTHANGTLPQNRHLTRINRFYSSENCAPAFSEGSFAVKGKNGKNIITTKILFSYAELFNKIFSDKKNIFDISESGIPLAVPEKNFACEIKKTGTDSFRKSYLQNETLQTPHEAESFLKKELSAINEALSLLENGEASPYLKKEKSLSSQIENLLKERDYLYLHFPDGTEFSMREDFLKRIKAELLFFKKQLTLLFP